MIRFSTLTLTSLLVLLLTVPALAADPEPMTSDEPIHVVADRLEVDNAQQVAHFIGSVNATQGDVKILSDQLDVYYEKAQDETAPAKETSTAEKAAQGMDEENSSVKKVVALGHVRITQKGRVAVGKKATYWAGARKMLLEGDATVWKGKNQVSGDKVTVYLDDNRTEVASKPGKRVSVTIVPKKGDK